MEDVIFFETAEEFGQWLAENGDSKTEVWVGYYKKGVDKIAITYPESVDLALRWGWIDGIRKGIDSISYKNRFTPRKAKSIWSATNIKRIEELTELGLMQPAGLKIFQARSADKEKLYAYENEERQLDEVQVQLFQATETAWQFFKAQSPSYQKTAIWWVISAKQEKTRQSRLATLIDASANGHKIAMYNYSAKPKP